MQTSYLQYMVEIERTRSITQAASNLFLSQPNLSRILHETEEQLGYPIFERFNRGVRPTEAGTAFLLHAKRILSEMEAIEGLGKGRRQEDRFRICMPRSAEILEMTVDYLNGLPESQPLDAVLRECHVRQALDYMAGGDSDVSIIRYRAEYREYFRDQAAGRRLRFEALNSYRYRVVVHRESPVAQWERICVADLSALTEITHGDTFRARRIEDEKRHKRIYSVDRHAQLALTARIPNAFMWSAPAPPEDLAAWNLVQRDVEDNHVEYQNALVVIEPELLSEIERNFIDFVRLRCKP